MTQTNALSVSETFDGDSSSAVVLIAILFAPFKGCEKKNQHSGLDQLHFAEDVQGTLKFSK